MSRSICREALRKSKEQPSVTFNIEEEILDQILACFDPEQEAETDVEEDIVKPVSIGKAVAAVDQLHRYESSRSKVVFLKYWYYVNGNGSCYVAEQVMLERFFHASYRTIIIIQDEIMGS